MTVAERTAQAAKWGNSQSYHAFSHDFYQQCHWFVKNHTTAPPPSRNSTEKGTECFDGLCT